MVRHQLEHLYTITSTFCQEYYKRYSGFLNGLESLAQNFYQIRFRRSIAALHGYIQRNLIRREKRGIVSPACIAGFRIRFMGGDPGVIMIQCLISFYSEVSFKRVEQKPIHGLIEKEFWLASFFGLFQLHMNPVHELLRYACEGITRTVGGSSQRGLPASQNVDIFRIGTSG